jgi:L-ascorbate metabolism protein UlaG (beta-lactamase superfamily)
MNNVSHKVFFLKKKMTILIIIFATLTVLAIIAFNLMFRLPQFGERPDYDQDPKILASKQFSNGSFHNSGKVEMRITGAKFLKMLKALLSGKNEERPPKDLIIANKSKINFEISNDSVTQITWFGHSALMIDIDGKRLLLDPMLSDNASPFSFAVSRFDNALHFSDEDLKKLGKIDAIIISHDHFDHLDYKTILKLKDQTTHFFVPLAVGSHLKHWGISAEKITELDYWEEVNYKGLTFVCTPSQHFSGRDPRHRNSSLWCSWVIYGETNKLFFSGDSGYFGGFKEVGDKYGPIDFAMLECGQYNELWHEIHMMPEETVQAGMDLGAKQILPIHNSAFSLSSHSWDEPQKRVKAAAKKSGVEVANIIPGESVIL